MLRFWNNPEFVRHRRAELRPVRAITVGAVVIAMCVLLGMACWSYERNILESAMRGLETYGTQAWKDRVEHLQVQFAHNAWLLYYRWLIGLQGWR